VAESLLSDAGAGPAARLARGGFLVDLLKASYLASRQEDHELLIDLLVESGHDAEALEASERSRARSLSDNLSGPPEALSLAEIQSAVLDRDTVLLEYTLGEDRSHLWWVARDGHGRVDLPGRSVLEPAVRKVYEALKVRPVRGLGAPGLRGAELSRQILAVMRRAQADLSGQVAAQVRETVGADTETGRAVIHSFEARFPQRDDDEGEERRG
jgi:hypothetical protein